MKRTISLILISVVLFGAALRLINLSQLPISLFGDEVDIGYQAYSLLKTGKDYLGNPFPVYFHSLTEYRMPGLVYATAPVIYFLGLNPLSVRLLPALFGIINLIQLFFFVRLLFQSPKGSGSRVALLATFVLAITPWHIHFSRAGFDVTFLLFSILLGLTLLLKSQRNNPLFFLSLFILSLSIYIYPTSIIFTPLITLALILIYRIKPDFSKKTQIAVLLIPLGLAVAPFLINYLSGVSSNRFNGINIFSDSKIIEAIITKRTEPWVLGSSLEQFFHNKPFAYASAFLSNYFKSLSSQFLFLTGDPNFRHSISGYGELLWVTAPFLLIGFVISFINLKKPASLLLLVWLFISPIASATTVDGGNHATRLFVMLPPLIIFTALGIEFVINKIKPKIALALLTLISLAFLVNLADYWHNYTSHYRYLSSRLWDYGYSDIFHQLSKVDSKGRVFINNTFEPSLIQFAFHTGYPPDQFQKQFQDGQTVTNIVPGFDGFRLGNYYFGEINKDVAISQLLMPEDVYLAVQLKEVPGDWDWRVSPPPGLRVIGSTVDVYQHPQFYLVTKNPQ